MSGSKLVGFAVAATILGHVPATAQTVPTLDGRLAPYIPHLLPPEARGPTKPKPSNQSEPKAASRENANACPIFLKTNPDVLRVVSEYARGSARNPNMTANQTVQFISSTITEAVRNSTNSATFARNASLYYNSLDHVDRSTIANCWSDLNGVIVSKEKREAIEAESQRGQNEAAQKREQEQKAAYAERARRQGEIDAQPSNRLLKAYRLYIAIKECFEARKGYAVVYLNEEQTAEAKTRVVAIEKILTGADPTINSDALWKEANRPDQTAPTNEMAAVFQLADALGKQWVSSPDWVDESNDYCKRSYSALSEQYATTVPRANEIRKDF